VNIKKIVATVIVIVLSTACFAQAPAQAPVIDWKYLAVAGAYATATGVDLWSTHHLLSTGKYKEGNPIMPQSLGGQLAMDSGIFACETFLSYRIKKNGSKWWFLGPSIGIGSHIFGATWNLTR
jgi:hypothetical protein